MSKSSIVTITASADVDVVSERISEDGRERFPNGVDRVAAGQSVDFIVHPGQSLRVVHVEPAPAAEDTNT